MKGTLTHDHVDALHRLPPHAIEAEMAVLGSILIDCTCLPAVREILPTSDHFTKPSNAVVYDAMIAGAAASGDGTIDIVLLNQRLEDTGWIKAAGGVDYLVALASSVPSALNVRHYARLVREKHLTFETLACAGQLLCALHYRPDEFREHIEAALAGLQEIRALASASPP